MNNTDFIEDIEQRGRDPVRCGRCGVVGGWDLLQDIKSDVQLSPWVCSDCRD